MTQSIKKLSQQHRDHLLSEGFTDDIIDKIVEMGLVESLTPDEAYKAGFGVAIDNKPVTGGLKFNFSETFSQLRLDEREIFKKENGKGITYLSVPGAIDRACAYIPEGCEAITEGMKDALAFSYIGGIPTGAIAGVSHVTKALPKGCGYIVIFDYDAWSNFAVFLDLIKAGVHCGGKVAIIPEIEGEPKAGGCEFLKSGKTAADYRDLIDSALTPIDIFKVWFDLQEITDITTAVTLAVNSSKLIGEIYGYASSGAVEHIKQLLKNSKLSDWNITPSNIIRDSNNTQKALKAKQRDEDETDSRNAVKIAIELVKERANLFHSPFPDSLEYAEIPSKTGAMTTHPVSSKEFKSWLTGEVYRETEQGITGESMNTILATVHAIAAHDSPEIPISEQRIADHNGRYYLYLADEEQTVIEYSALVWNICENSPVKFVFDKYKAPLPIPRHDGKIDKLWDFTRITDTPDSPDRLMVTSVLVKGLVPGGTDPILAISGYAGSGKTTAANFLRSLIDPFTKGKVLSKLPEQSDHIAIHAQKRRILAIDNVSHISADQSDFLCTVSTGGGITKRKLHSDSEEIIHDVQNLMILTSIGNVVTKPDLLERSIVIEAQRITAEDRLSEGDIAKEFDIHQADILGGLLNITVDALHHRNITEAPRYNRMTEFCHLGEGVQKKLKYASDSISRRMAAGVEIANNIAIESSPVASTLSSWISTYQGVWTGTASDLLNILKSYSKKSELAGSLPKTATTLSSELKRVESALYQTGVKIESNRTKTARLISVYLHSAPIDKGEKTNVNDLPPKDKSKSASSASPYKNESLETLHSNGSSDDAVGDALKDSASPLQSYINIKASHSNGSSDDAVGDALDDEFIEVDEV